METADSSNNFVPSQLGLKEYWDGIYANELDTFREVGDVGEVWFGYASVKRIVAWFDRKVSKDVKILDIGCGNGVTLIELYKHGYRNLVGVDYSQDAVNLARAIALERKADIIYEVCDIVDNLLTQSGVVREQYDICLDKGTYDAICLCPQDVELKKKLYVANIYKLTKENGLFIITSCNWTKDELTEQFKDQFLLVETIPSPSIQFGGQTGKKETVLILKKLLCQL